MAAVLVLLARLHVRRLYSHRLRTLLAVLAVAAGTSLALGVIVVIGSIDASFARFGRVLGGPAPLRVVGATQSGGLPPATLVAVTGTPGVAAAVPLVQASSVVRTRTGRDIAVVVIGAGCDAARLVGITMCSAAASSPAALASPGASANPADPGGPLLIGEALFRTLGAGSWLQTDLGVLPTAGSTPVPALDALAGGNVVVTGLTRAEALFDRGVRYDLIEIVPARGTRLAAVAQRIERRIGPAYRVLRAGQPPPEMGLATAAFVPLLALVAVLAAGIATVLVYDVMALSLEERRRQQAVVAALGAPPWMMTAGPAAESAIIGAVGGLVGAGAGGLLAGTIVAPISAFSAALLGVPVTVHLSPVDVLLGLAFGVVIGIAAVARPLRRMVRGDVAAELAGRNGRAEADVSSRWPRLVAAAAFTAAAVVLAVVGARHDALAGWQPPAALAGFVASAVGSVLIVAEAAALPLVALVGRWPQGRGGQRWAAVRIGVANAAREPGRVGVMAVAVAGAVGVGIVTGGYAQGLAAGTTAQVTSSVRGHGVVVDTAAGTSGDNSDARLPADVVTEIAAVPGVARVVSSTAVLSGNSASTLVFVTAAASPAGGPALVQGSASPGPFRSGAVMVGVGLARRQRLRPGSTVRLDTPEGVVAVPVEGIWEDGAVDGDTVTMNPGALARLFEPQLPGAVTAVPAAGVSVAAVAGAIRRLPLPPDVTVTAPGPYLREQVTQLTGQLAPFWALERALLVVAFVGVLATLLLVGVQRRRQIGLLGALGMAPDDVFRMVVAEAACVGVVGAALGVAVGAGVLAVMLQVAPLLIGYHDPYRFDAGALAVTVPVAVVVAVAAALLPAWRAARMPVVRALSDD